MEIPNLDFECAKTGQNIVRTSKRLEGTKKRSEVENPIQKSLGILQEDGIYALFVYLDSEGAFDDREGVEKLISKNLWKLLRKDELGLVTKEWKKENVYPQLQNELCKNLDNLFLAKSLLEKALIYARYHAKALPEKLGN